ncbi:hypothetical protein MPC1_60009 [Methylocella tundrae]|nr:hypothetical protein MPC1_60009 [Methylocella tundrae]
MAKTERTGLETEALQHLGSEGFRNRDDSRTEKQLVRIARWIIADVNLLNAAALREFMTAVPDASPSLCSSMDEFFEFPLSIEFPSCHEDIVGVPLLQPDALLVFVHAQRQELSFVASSHLHTDNVDGKLLPLWQIANVKDNIRKIGYLGHHSSLPFDSLHFETGTARRVPNVH